MSMAHQWRQKHIHGVCTWCQCDFASTGRFYIWYLISKPSSCTNHTHDIENKVFSLYVFPLIWVFMYSMYNWCTIQRSFDTKSQFSCVGLCVRLYNASSIVLFDPRASQSSLEVPYPSISHLSLAPTDRALSRATQRGPCFLLWSPWNTAQIKMREITF